MQKLLGLENSAAAYVVFATVFIVLFGRFVDYLLGKQGTERFKQGLLAAYITLDGLPRTRQILQSIFDGLRAFVTSLPGSTSTIKFIAFIFLFSYLWNWLFFPWLDRIAWSYTSGLLSSPNGSQQSYVPNYLMPYIIGLTLIPQSIFDTVSILATIKIAQFARRSGVTAAAFAELFVSLSLWVLNTCATIWVFQRVMGFYWNCFGWVRGWLGDRDNSCDYSLNSFAWQRNQEFKDIFISVTSLDFNSQVASAGDPYDVSFWVTPLMSATSLWPSLLIWCSMAIAILIVPLMFFLRRPTMLILNRLDELPEKVMQSIAVFFAALIAIVFAVYNFFQ